MSWLLRDVNLLELHCNIEKFVLYPHLFLFCNITNKTNGKLNKNSFSSPTELFQTYLRGRAWVFQSSFLYCLFTIQLSSLTQKIIFFFQLFIPLVVNTVYFTPLLKLSRIWQSVLLCEYYSPVMLAWTLKIEVLLSYLCNVSALIPRT